MEKITCLGKTKKGLQCKNPPSRGMKYCHLHTPAGAGAGVSAKPHTVVEEFTRFLEKSRVRSSLFLPKIGRLTRRHGKQKIPVDLHDVAGLGTPNQALVYYARTGYLDGVKHALGLGADIHAEDDAALRWAAENGHLPVVRYLLDERVGEKANIHAVGDEALRWASCRGRLPIVKYLLDERIGEKANIHERDDEALRWAVREGHLPVVRYLLERKGEKANIHAYNDSALGLAALIGHLPVVRYLLEKAGEQADIHAENDDALRWAASEGHLPVVRYLLDERVGEKANIHAWDDGALRAAARGGHLPVVRYLVSRGANVAILTPAQRARYGV